MVVAMGITGAVAAMGIIAGSCAARSEAVPATGEPGSVATPCMGTAAATGTFATMGAETSAAAATGMAAKGATAATKVPSFSGCCAALPMLGPTDNVGLCSATETMTVGAPGERGSRAGDLGDLWACSWKSFVRASEGGLPTAAGTTWPVQIMFINSRTSWPSV